MKNSLIFNAAFERGFEFRRYVARNRVSCYDSPNNAKRKSMAEICNIGPGDERSDIMGNVLNISKNVCESKLDSAVFAILFSLCSNCAARNAFL